jgi:hypothetical protein
LPSTVELEITGYIDEATYRDYISASDFAIQLRVSPYLGVSGPLSDLASFGTPGVTTEGLAADVDVPEFLRTISNDFSVLDVAELIMKMSREERIHRNIDEHRQSYINAKSPEKYANEILHVVNESVFN